MAPKESTETAPVASVDAKVAKLLASTQTAHTESVATSSSNLLSLIAEDVTVSEPTGSALHADLANIVTGLKDKLPEEKVDTNKYLRPANISNLQTPQGKQLIGKNNFTHLRSAHAN